MKKRDLLKILLIAICLVVGLSTFFGCATASGEYDYGYPSSGYDAAVGDLSGDKISGTVSSETGEVASGGESGSGNSVNTAGLMTAGAHNDNDYYELYKSLFISGQTADENGKFFKFLGDKDWGLNTLNRVKVTVNCSGAPAANVKVLFTGKEEKLIFTAQTDSNGVAYVFGNSSGGKITAINGEEEKSVTVDSEAKEATIELSNAPEKGKVIEIMLVVDVTGSMGDELNYLKRELSDVVNRIASSFSDAKINLSLLFYRDVTDKVKFADTDFLDVTDAKNLQTQQKFINKQSATGGGDYEEAVDEALELAVSKQWSENSTKIIFHVLDATPHSGEVYKTRFKNAVTMAAEKGIRICPVLASGADEVTEYLTRQSAVMTGGTFVFITDHSGIGGSHLDPEIPNVIIEKLNDLMVRLVKGYYTGTFPDAVCFNGKEYFTIDASNVESGFIVSGAKRCYAAGDTVTIYTKFVQDIVNLYVDGEKVCQGTPFTEDVYSSSKGAQTYLKFTFIMPNKNVVVSFEITQNNQEIPTGIETEIID